MQIVEPVRSVSLGGIRLHPIRQIELIEFMRAHMANRQKCIVLSQNLHGMSVWMHDKTFRDLHTSPDSIVHIDGLPLVYLSRMAGAEAERSHRITLVDFIFPLLTMARDETKRVFYIGGRPEDLEKTLSTIHARLPDLELSAYHGYLNDDLTRTAAAEAIVAFQPSLILVGMGMGKQEAWIAQNHLAFPNATIMTIGACMEYFIGRASSPPRWTGPMGVEWLWRLLSNPGRFWNRYLIEPWPVLLYLLLTARNSRYGRWMLHD